MLVTLVFWMLVLLVVLCIVCANGKYNDCEGGEQGAANCLLMNDVCSNTNSHTLTHIHTHTHGFARVVRA